MTDILDLDFAGTDGDPAPSPLTSNLAGTGTSLTIVGNQLQLLTRVGGNAGGIQIDTNLSAFLNGDSTFFFTTPATVREFYLYIKARTSGGWPATHQLNFGLEVGANTDSFLYLIDDGGSTLASFHHGNILPGNTYGMKIVLAGGALELRFWNVSVGQDETTGRILTGTTSWTTAGTLQVEYTGPAAVINPAVLLVDDWLVTSPDATPQTITGAPLVLTYSMVAGVLTVAGGAQTITATPLVVTYSIPAGTLTAPERTTDIDHNELWIRAVGDTSDGFMAARAPSNGTADLLEIRSGVPMERRIKAVRTTGAFRWFEWVPLTP